MKRIWAFLLSLALLLCVCPAISLQASADAVASGTLGDNLTWVRDGEGTLTISGTGPMIDLDPFNQQWRSGGVKIKKVVIESGVTTIGRNAFFDHVSITDVAIPDSVTSIGEGAFYRCSSLLTIAIPNSVSELGLGAFAGCTSLSGIWVDQQNPYYCNGDNGELYSKDKTTLVVCPSGYSGAYIIPDSVTTIGKGAFGLCYDLTSVTIPDSVTAIGKSAFAQCTSLKGVTIPDGVSTISDSAFGGCASLTSASIPVSVTAIDRDAFYGCYSLTDVYYSGSKAQWDEISIDSGCTALTSATIHTVEPPPVEIVSQPANSEVIAGVVAQFDVMVTDAASYQWQYRRNEVTPWVSTTLDGYDQAILLVPAILSRNGYQYRCRVTGTDGRIIYSEPATLTVLDSIVITTQPTRQVATSDENAIFTVAAEGAGLTYQWMYRKSDEDFWKQTGMAGNRTDTLTVPALLSRNGYQYRCAITDENGVKIYSNAATLSAIGFTVDPADQTAAVNTNAVFTAAAEGQDLTYQWQYRKTEDGAWMNTTLTGCKTDTLTVLAIASRNGYQYRCRITDALGIIRYSDPATLTVE